MRQAPRWTWPRRWTLWTSARSAGVADVAIGTRLGVRLLEPQLGERNLSQAVREVVLQGCAQILRSKTVDELAEAAASLLCELRAAQVPGRTGYPRPHRGLVHGDLAPRSC